MGVFARPQELVAVYLGLVGIGLAAAFGWSLRSLIAVLVAAAVLGLANRRLTGTDVSLWRGLCITAAWNPTGTAMVGLLLLLPRLLSATAYALGVVVIGLPLPFSWTRMAWLARLRTEPAVSGRSRR